MISMQRTFLTTAAWLSMIAAPALAHHAFGGEFDANRPVLLKGKVTRVEWVNPHAWIHLEVAKPDGLNKDSLPAGTEIVVDGYQARDHSLLRANGRNVTYPDGRKLFLGSSGPGAPPENATPTDKAKPQ